jgi:hypothetical protein
VSGGAGVVVLLGIGPELGAALEAPPLFGGRHQCAADAAAASLGHHEPSLEERHPVGRASLRVGPDGELGKAEGFSVLVLREENGRRLARLPGEELSDVLLMLAFRAFRPEDTPLLQPDGGIAGANGPDGYGQCALS